MVATYNLVQCISWSHRYLYWVFPFSLVMRFVQKLKYNEGVSICVYSFASTGFGGHHL